MSDYLATINVSGGGGSWYRHPDRDTAIKKCLRTFRKDWSSLFKLDGATVNVAVFDVTGMEVVRWDDRGIRGEDGKYIERPVEYVTHTYRKSKALK